MLTTERVLITSDNMDAVNQVEGFIMQINPVSQSEGGVKMAQIVREINAAMIGMQGQVTALQYQIKKHEDEIENLKNKETSRGGQTLKMSSDKATQGVPLLHGEKDYRTFAFKMKSYLKERYEDLHDVCEGLDNKASITEKDMEDYEDRVEDLKRLSAELYGLLVQKSEDKALPVIMNVKTGNGLEAWRRFSCEFGAKSELTDEGLLGRMINWPRCTSLEQVPSQFEQFDMTMKEYVGRTASEGTKLGKSFEKSVMMRIVPEAIKKTLESQTQAVSADQVRAYIRQQLDLARRNKASPMDLNPIQEDPSKQQRTQEKEEWPIEEEADLDAMAKGKGKGKGKWFSGCFKCGLKNHMAKDCTASPDKIAKYQAEKGTSKGGQYGKNNPWQQWQQPQMYYGKSGAQKGKGKGYGVYDLEYPYQYPYFQPPPLGAVQSGPPVIGGFRLLSAVSEAKPEDEWKLVQKGGKAKMPRVKKWQTLHIHQDDMHDDVPPPPVPHTHEDEDEE